jgi:hypothetical protein
LNEWRGVISLHSVPRTEVIHVEPQFAALLAQIGFGPEWIFNSVSVVPWRTLADRENCTIDTTPPAPPGADGRRLRLHVKRYPAKFGKTAQAEAAGLTHLMQANIPCAPLVAHGRLADGRGFVITADLAGYEPADKLIARGIPFDRLLGPTADLAGRLHGAGLHHRDLYLCHFLVRLDAESVDIKLIDAARVRPLRRFPTRKRWIVKDLAQFWYSTQQLRLSDEERHRWLAEYAKTSGIDIPSRTIQAKAAKIAAHDAKLNEREPERHVSLGDKRRGLRTEE